MKIGIFLGYGPQTILGKEGLGRYLAGLLKGFQERGEEISIACPHWLLETLDSLFKDFGIDKSGLRILETGKTPALWRVYSRLTRKKEKRGFLKRLVVASKVLMQKLLDDFARVNSVLIFLLLGLLPLLLGLAVVIPSALLGLVILVFCSALILFALVAVAPSASAALLLARLKLGKKINRQLPGKLRKRVSAAKGKGHVPAPRRIALWTFGRMVGAEAEKLVQMINSEQPMDVWFVPAIFWPQVTGIQNSTVVINAPDLVSERFPQGFADVINADNAIIDCRETLGKGKYFITYCEYLRQSLLVEEYGKSAANTVAIPHVNNAMDGYLYIDPALKARMGVEKDLSHEFAKCLLPLALWNASGRLGYLNGFSLGNAPYIFYASQVRPSKNILNLVKAYEYLLRHRFIHHKLVITCDINRSEELKKYIADHELENDVLCLWNVPARVLAALYNCADLVVNPTLYEGGFPFTFGEGMSVGTPSLMSDIPQVREVLEPAGLEEILFDPYDWMAMAKKIEWGIRNKEELYRKELPLYEKLAERTPEVVAAEYIDAFARFIQLDGRQVQG